MSGSFEDMLREMRMPDSSDIKIVLPDAEGFEAERERARREREQRETDAREEREQQEQREAESRDAQAEEQSAGEHGGAGGGSQEQVSQASQAPEPAPQRDDPDEGEHSSSEGEEPVVAAEEEADPEPEPVVEEAPSDDAKEDEEPGDEEGEEEEDALRPEIVVGQTTAAERDRQAVQMRKHFLQGAKWDRSVGFSFDGKNDSPPPKAPKNESDADKAKREALPPSRTTQMKTFPKALVEALRRAAEPAYGTGELDEASAASLLTAFIIARTGIRVPGIDANTEGLAKVFSSAEPHLVALEDRLEDFHRDVDELSRGLALIGRRVAEIGESVDSVEMSNAYLLADRVDPISTDGVTAATIDLLDRRAQAAGRKAREASKAERRRKQYENGRSY